MYCFLCKKILQNIRSRNSTNKLCFLQISTLRFISTSTYEHPFTVSYLINSCGLPQEAAISASKKIQLETPERPDLVLSLFRNHGFSDTQISKVIKRDPAILLANPQKILKPKLEFFHNIGFSAPELAKILSSDPDVLRRSLKNQIIPSFDILMSFLKTEKDVSAAIKRTTWILGQNLQKHIVPNISLLRDNGVPHSKIAILLRTQPRVLMGLPDRFKEVVNQIMEMGFEPSKTLFILAIHGMTGISKSTWGRKLEVYRRWGLSEEEIVSAFKKQPHCMMLSEEKITKGMDFLVNKMGWKSSVIAERPSVLSLSLEKRIIPRCSVIQVLKSKGLIQTDLNLTILLKHKENYFLKKFVTMYEKEVPQLMEIYQGKMERF